MKWYRNEHPTAYEEDVLMQLLSIQGSIESVQLYLQYRIIAPDVPLYQGVLDPFHRTASACKGALGTSCHLTIGHRDDGLIDEIRK